MTRERDEVKVQSEAGEFTRFTSLQITNDLMAPSEAAFELGDDGSWRELEAIVALGKSFQVFVNGRLHMTGRVEMSDAPIDPGSGSTVRFAVRTKLADAVYCSADPKIRVKGVPIFAFLFDVYSKLGYTERDFEFQADVTRDLMTGKGSDGSEAPADLESINEDQAKVNPPETIYSVVQKHLARHGLMHWDSPDGKIVIGAPNDQQPPLYHLRMRLGANGRENNILNATRTRDISGVPSLLIVAGSGGKKEWTKAKVKGFAGHPELIEAGFARPVLVLQEGAKTDAIAARIATRMLTDRSKRLDAWTVRVDGLSYWNGYDRIVYGVDTVADVVTDVAGGPAGAYLIHRVVKTRDASSADVCDLSLLKRGLWVL